MLKDDVVVVQLRRNSILWTGDEQTKRTGYNSNTAIVNTNIVTQDQLFCEGSVATSSKHCSSFSAYTKQECGVSMNSGAPRGNESSRENS